MLSAMSISAIAVSCPKGYSRCSHSASQTKTVFGQSYTYDSFIEPVSSGICSYGGSVSSTEEMLEGYVGVKTRLYSSSGSLVVSSDWLYLPTDWAANYNCHFGSQTTGQSGTHYSKSQVQLYNGDGYTTYTCNATPNIQVTRSAPYISTNQKGETFGSELFLDEFGITPDLIAAIGQDGIEGYVKATDLNVSAVSSLTESITYNASLTPERTIPLYAADGETVLGSFTVQNNIAFS